MKIVLDTNIFISGIFWTGDSYKILELWENGELQVICSLEIISEISRILSDFKIQLPADMKEKWINRIINKCIIADPEEHFDIVPDKTDNKFIDAAIAGNASYIITNDKHLLKIKEFNGVKIITPKDYLFSQ